MTNLQLEHLLAQLGRRGGPGRWPAPASGWRLRPAVRRFPGRNPVRGGCRQCRGAAVRAKVARIWDSTNENRSHPSTCRRQTEQPFRAPRPGGLSERLGPAPSDRSDRMGYDSRPSQRSPFAHGARPRSIRPRRSQRFQRDHRDPDELGAGQVRGGQGQRRDLRRSRADHADALSVQLRLHPAHALRRRRPGRRAGDHADAADPRLGDPLPHGRHAEDGRRGRRGHRRSSRCRSARCSRPTTRCSRWTTCPN